MGNIVVNGLFLNDYSSGVHRTACELINALSGHSGLSHPLEVLMCDKSKVSLVESDHVKLRTLPWDTRHPLLRVIRENLALPSFVGSNGYDLYHSLNYVLPYSLPIPGVVTVHDIISVQFPQYCQQSSAMYHHLFMKHSFRQARKIIAVSNSVKEDLISVFGIPEKKIDVIYHGIGGNMTRVEDKQRLDAVVAKYKLPERFVLFVGNIEPKKNLCRVVEAFALLKRQGNFDHKLVLVGRKGWKYRAVLTQIRDSGVKNDIMMLGPVSQNALPVFYSLADLLVFPSLYEGFGLPPLEAMACGTPVVASRAGSLPEITGANCILVDPVNTHEIMAGMKTILDDPSLKNRLVQSGLSWASQFRWSDAAAATVNVYNALV